MTSRYRVQLSVVEVTAPAVLFGGTSLEELLNVSVGCSDLGEIRSIVDGLLFEGIPATQREDEKDPSLGTLMATGASGVVKIESGRVVMRDENAKPGPTIGAGYRVPEPEPELPGGKHSGNCVCSACAEPDETEPPLITPRPIKDNPQA